MTAFINSYRPKTAMFGILLALPLLARSETVEAASAQTTSGIVLKQAQSTSSMSASVDQQKAAIGRQLGIAAPADAFFTAAWSTPAAIPLPHLIASCSAMPETDLLPLVQQNAKDQQLQPELIRAVIRRESASYACAVSDRGAVGLMQLMPDVAEQFAADPLDPAENIRAGSQYLKQLMTRYKDDVKLALAAYNAGPQRVDADHKVPDIPETAAYVKSILEELNRKDLNRNAATPR